MTKPHPLVNHPNYLQAIGTISVETGQLELELSGLFARLLGLTLKVGRAIYLTPKSEQVRLDVLRNAAAAYLAPDKRRRPDSAVERQKARALAKINGILSKAQTAVNSRHRIIHDAWKVSDEGHEISRFPIDGRIEPPEYTAMPLAKLEQQVQSLQVLIAEARALRIDFRDHPPHMVALADHSRKSG